MNTKQLRQKILELAIRGKLVPQDPNDEPASVLLESIRAEKERLIKEGKIRRDKNESKIASSDKSHYGELPQGWELVSLSQLASFAGGKTPSTSNAAFWNGWVNWVTSKDMKSKYIYSTQIQMSELGAADMQLFPSNTLLMVVRSGILRRTLPLAILKSNSTVNQDLKTISFYMDAICEFVYYYLTATENEILTHYQKDGTTVESIDFERFRDIKIPLPPLGEQQRIVSAILSSFVLIDDIETSKGDLLSAVTAAKAKILSLAISGKFVSQDPTDEPASVLLERIQAERNALVDKGKVKKSTATPIVKTADNSHYEQLPKNWALTSLGEIAEIIRGITFPATAKMTEGSINTVRCLTTGSVQAEHRPSSDVFVDKGFVRNDNLWLQNKDIVMSSANSTELVGKSFVWKKDVEATFGGFLTVIRCDKPLNGDYIGLLLQYLWQKGAFIVSSTQTTNIANINNQVLSATEIALPPLNEQQRIVATIETQFELLNSISKTLN